MTKGYYYPEAQKRYYDKHKEAIKRRRANKRYNMTTLYGINPSEYDALLEKQNGKCAICDKPSEDNTHGRLYIDHCHTANHVRGLLCNNCNTGLGNFKDDVNFLQAAIKYLNGKTTSS
jgi:hypothetical protein